MECPVCDTQVSLWMRSCPRCAEPLSERVDATSYPFAGGAGSTATRAGFRETERAAAFGVTTERWPADSSPAASVSTATPTATPRPNAAETTITIGGRTPRPPQPRRVAGDVDDPGIGGRRWLVPAGLTVVVLAIAAGSWFAFHGHAGTVTPSPAAGNGYSPAPASAGGGGTNASSSSPSPSPEASSSFVEQASESPSAGPSEASSPAVDVFDQLSNVESILDDSARSRSELHAALQAACTTPTTSLNAMDDVATQRQNEIGQAEDLDLSAVPNGEELQSDLVSFLQASATADEAYRNYVEAVSVGGCDAGKSAYDEGNALSADAQSAKTAFFEIWTPLADQYGLPPHSTADV